MSTWMYSEDMDKMIDRVEKDRVLWEESAIARDNAVNLLIDRLLDIGEASWLLTHPNETIRRSSFGKYSSRQPKPSST